MFKRLFIVFAIVLGMFEITAVPAFAHQITSATANITCDGNNDTLTVMGFTDPGEIVSISYTIMLTPTSGSGSPITFSGTLQATGGPDGSFVGPPTVTLPIGPLTDNYTLDGSFATLNTPDGNTIPITGNSVMCQGPPPPPPPNCVGQSTNTANFNGTQINPGSTIWFNSNFTAAGIPSTGATINFSSTIQLNGTTLIVPNAVIMFSPSASCASTSFDSSTNTWMTIVPLNGGDEIFLAGLAFPVPASGIPGGVKNVAWNGNFSTNTPGISIQWKWGAAVYSGFTDYNSLSVKASHQNACNVNNGDHAGTPENPAVKSSVIGGATGGGGSNWTGSWSGTVRVGFICQ